MRSYGNWAGDPEGTPEDPTRCIEELMDGYISRQCTRKRGYGPDGLYCKQHSPDAVAARREAARARWRQERADTAGTPSDLADAAERAIKIIKANLYHQSEKVEDAVSILEAALARARGKQP